MTTESDYAAWRDANGHRMDELSDIATRLGGHLLAAGLLVDQLAALAADARMLPPLPVPAAAAAFAIAMDHCASMSTATSLDDLDAASNAAATALLRMLSLLDEALEVG